MLNNDIVSSVFKSGFQKDYLILKESIRFFTHCLVNQKCQTQIPMISSVCKLNFEGLHYFEDKETIDLSLLSLSLISQFDTSLVDIAKHIEIFEYLSERSSEELLPHAELLTLLILNLSMIPENATMIVRFNFVGLFHSFMDFVNETCHSYILSILIQVFKYEFTEEIFAQEAHGIIIKLLERNYPHFLSDILKLINVS